jgi:outer membrane protein assembly factor BamA
MFFMRSCGMIFLLLLSFLFHISCTGSAYPSDRPYSVTIQLPAGQAPVFGKLSRESFVVGTINLRADIALDQDEMQYLLHIKPGDRVTSELIALGLGYIAKKNKFESAKVTYTPQEQTNTVDLVFEFISRWTFKKLIVTGLAVGRDQVVQQYEFDPGDPFHEKKHTFCVEKIKKELCEQGFLNVDIKDSLDWDVSTKEVTPTVYIKRGKKFIIGDVDVTLIAKAGMAQDLETVRQEIQSRFVHMLTKRRYQKSVVDEQGAQLAAYLAQQGYMQAQIAVDQTINIQKHTVALQVQITLHDRRVFAFSGAHNISEDELRNCLIELGASAQLLPAPLLADELLRLYQAQGFDHVTIQVTEAGDRTLFVISEGERTALQAVELRGVTCCDSSALARHFFQESLGGFYQEDAITGHVEALLGWYRAQGFRDIRILDRSWSSGKLTLHLDEGPRYVLRLLSVPGHAQLEEKLKKFVSDPENLVHQPTLYEAQGIPFVESSLVAQRRIISEYFIKQGYLYGESSFDVTGETKDGIRYVDVRWILDPKRLVQLGKAVVAGVSPVPFYFLQRELQWDAHEKWNKDKIDVYANKLRELDLFETLHCVPASSLNGTTNHRGMRSSDQSLQHKAVMIRAVPYDPFELRIRAGVLGIAKNLTWREGATYKVGGSLLYRNLANYGGQLRIDGDVFKFEQRIAASYRHPWLFGLPFRTTLKGYYNRYIQPVVIGKRLPLYVALQQGCLLSISRKFSPITFGFSTGFEWLETEVKNAQAARAINFVPQLNKVQIPYWFAEPTLVLDYLDNKVYPSSGAFTLFSCKGMLPLQRVSPFLKLLLDQTLFIPIARVLVGGIRIRVGHVFSTRFSQIMPPDRFFLGGAHSVRGYEPDHVPPLGVMCDPDTGKNILVPQGGRTMANVNLELRFPLYKKLSGVLFQDFGALIGDEFVSVIKERVVAGSGLGVRYNTPIGPLRFDVAMKWRKSRPEESRFAWYVTLDNFF